MGAWLRIPQEHTLLYCLRMVWWFLWKNARGDFERACHNKANTLMSSLSFDIFFVQNLTFHGESCWCSAHFALVAHDTGPVSCQSGSRPFPHNIVDGLTIWSDFHLLHEWAVVHYPLHTGSIGPWSHITADRKAVVQYWKRWRAGHYKVEDEIIDIY